MKDMYIVSVLCKNDTSFSKQSTFSSFRMLLQTDLVFVDGVQASPANAPFPTILDEYSKYEKYFRL